MSLTRLHWSLYFLVITTVIAATGAIVGALAFVMFGLVTGADFSQRELAVGGAKTLGFYFTLWAPGIAIVLCVKRAYEHRQRRS